MHHVLDVVEPTTHVDDPVGHLVGACHVVRGVFLWLLRELGHRGGYELPSLLSVEVAVCVFASF